ncbi:hypothetical protein E2C01_025157 [Portunus trituberculatus]|uniref:Uncharacterized protein n=1 Tax=Portunus trituberculatus TaxID=210409 RepID=A0A5B7EEU4_PORTR|nr:hypothetical protein [Portunus trituberculatus]
MCQKVPVQLLVYSSQPSQRMYSSSSTTGKVSGTTSTYQGSSSISPAPTCLPGFLFYVLSSSRLSSTAMYTGQCCGGLWRA